MSFDPAPELRKPKYSRLEDEDDEMDYIPPPPSPKKPEPKVEEEKEKEEEKKTSNIMFAFGVSSSIVAVTFLVYIIFFFSPKPDLPIPMLTHYRLWTDPHPTKSSDLNVQQNGKHREIASILQSALAVQSKHYACICMHHLELSAEYGSSRACMVQGVLLINPTLKGASTTKNKWRQWSVACNAEQNPLVRERFESVYIDWEDWKTNDHHWMHFNGIESACLQLALEEMDGTVVC